MIAWRDGLRRPESARVRVGRRRVRHHLRTGRGGTAIRGIGVMCPDCSRTTGFDRTTD